MVSGSSPGSYVELRNIWTVYGHGSPSELVESACIVAMRNRFQRRCQVSVGRARLPSWVPMEASEKPQLSLDEPAPTGTVRALDDRLVIEDLTVDDERAARVVRERAAGRQAAGRHRAQGDRDRRPRPRQRGDRGQRRLRAGGARARRSGSVSRELGEQTWRLVIDGARRAASRPASARSGATPSQAQIKEHRRDRSRRAARRPLLASSSRREDGSNPLVRLQGRRSVKALPGASEQRQRRRARRHRESHRRSSARSEIVELKERQREADERVAEAEEAGTRKGRTFEERSTPRSTASPTRAATPPTTSATSRRSPAAKKGDVVVEIDGATGTGLGTRRRSRSRTRSSRRTRPGPS